MQSKLAHYDLVITIKEIHILINSDPQSKRFKSERIRCMADGCQVMAKAHMTLWVKWAKNEMREECVQFNDNGSNQFSKIFAHTKL